MIVALVRHGETDENHFDRLQGRSNHLLNETGKRQARKLREEIASKKYDICYVSPLARSVETAMILVGDRVLMLNDDRLIERDLGQLEGHIRKEYDTDIYWDYDLNTNKDGVETVHDLFKRCEDFLNFLKSKNYQSVLIVSHSAIYRTLRYLLKNKELKGKLYDGIIKNCQYEEFEI